MMMTHDGRPYAAGWTKDRDGERGAVGSASSRTAEQPARTGDDGNEATTWGLPLLGESRAPASLRRLMRTLLDGCVIGGVTLAPILSVLGCVGLILPAQSLLHQVASLLLYTAVVWLVFSLSAAHLCSSKPTAQTRDSAKSAAVRGDDESGAA